MKKETRGRPSKKHEPIKASFGDVIEALADSNYKPKRRLKAKNKK